MKKYRVTLIKYEIYEVYGEDENVAIGNACALADGDPDSWTNPVDEFEVEEVEVN